MCKIHETKYVDKGASKTETVTCCDCNTVHDSSYREYLKYSKGKKINSVLVYSILSLDDTLNPKRALQTHPLKENIPKQAFLTDANILNNTAK